MNINKKILFFIVLCIFFIVFYIISNTFAKYLSSANSSANIAIAKWNIKVNNISIKDNTDISSTIIPVFPGNENISNNVIAPTAEGYFDLVIDINDVDVSFKYTITSIVDESSPVKDFSITGYSIDNGPKIEFGANEEKVITETILLNSNISNRNIRIYIKWIDDDSQTMNNAEDTLATVSGNPAVFDVIINFSQIVDTNTI